MADLDITLFGADSVSYAVLTTAYDGLLEAANYIVDNSSSISGADIDFVDTSHSVNCSDRYSDVNTWLDNNGYEAPTHCLWLTQCLQSNTAPTGGWDQSRRTAGFVSVAYHSGQDLKAATVHEGLHPFINENLGSVQSMTDGLTTDHPLGRMYIENGVGYITPMLFTYKNEYNDTGSCTADTEPADPYPTLEVSTCTLTALGLSHDHEN